MSLTFGRAPFAAQRGSFDFPVPDHVRYWEPWPRRMRAILGGATVLDSRRGVVLHETGRLLSTTTPLTTSIRICSVPPSRPRLAPPGGTWESLAESPLLRSPPAPISPARTAG